MMYTQETINAVAARTGLMPAAIAGILEALESTAEQKALRANDERYRYLRDRRISGGEMPCLAQYQNGRLVECLESSELVDWLIDERMQQSAKVLDDAIDKARHD